MFDVVTFGSATREVFLKSAGLRTVKNSKFETGEAACLSLGSKVDVDDIVFTTGGGGTNNAVGFARQGLKTACLGESWG